MVASAASTKAPALSYAEHAKKAQGVKLPIPIRQQISSSSSVASPTHATSPVPPSKPNAKPSSIDVSVGQTAGPSTRIAAQEPSSTVIGTINGQSHHAENRNPMSARPNPTNMPAPPMPPSSSSTSSAAKPPLENVWNRRKEQMASKAVNAASTTTSISGLDHTPPIPEVASQNKPPSPSSAEEDPFVVRVPSHMRKPPPVGYTESWPEVGKSAEVKEASPGSNGGGRELDPPTPRKSEKPKWVPIPPSELQAAADAVAQQNRKQHKQHSRSHSRNQSQNALRPSPSSRPNNLSIVPNTASQSGSQNPSQIGSQVPSRIQSGRTSAVHSRIASRSNSTQSSPRLARGGRRLEEDSLGLNGTVGPVVPVSVPSNATNSPRVSPLAPLMHGEANSDSHMNLYVDTSNSHPTSYPTPIYGPVPVAGSPYYANPNHGSGLPPHPALPLHQTPSQQGSTPPFRPSPLSASSYGMPPGGPNRYPPTMSNHSHSPIPPPSQPSSAYPGGYSPMYPHMYGGMSEYAQNPPYPYWNGHGYSMPVSGTQSPPYPPHMMSYPPPQLPHHLVQHSQPIDRPSSNSPPDEQYRQQLPPPTMIDHPPPPEVSQPLAGYREVAVMPVLTSGAARQGNGNASDQAVPVVFGSIDAHGSLSPVPSPAFVTPSARSRPSENNSDSRPEEPVAQDIESLKAGFTAFTIGVSPDDPAPPRLRSRTRSSNSLSHGSPSITLPKKDSSVGQLGETARVNGAKDYDSARSNGVTVIDLTDGTETKWQFGTTSVSSPPLDQADTVSHPQPILEDLPPQSLNVVNGGTQLPPLPLDLQPTPNMIATDSQPPPSFDAAVGEDEFAVKNFGYGFGMAAGTGYPPMFVPEDHMARDRQREDIRDDRTRWREDNEFERGSRAGRERDIGEFNGNMGMGRPRRGSYGGYGGYERGVFSGRRGRGGGYARGFHRPRASYHAPPSRQPPFQVTPPHQFQPLMTYNDPSTANGYYQHPQIPPHQPLATYLPQPPVGGYETYVPQPQPSQQIASSPTPSGPPVPQPISPLSFPLDSTRYYLLGQLEYYMSPQNIIKDFFLRQQMDSRGWIPIALFASFKRVIALTADINLVRDVLILSSIVEVRDDWVRMKDWEQFVLPDAAKSHVEASELYAYSVNHTSHDANIEHDDGDGEVDEEDEEEDVVFVIDDGSQRWPPDRR